MEKNMTKKDKLYLKVNIKHMKTLENDGMEKESNMNIKKEK